MKDLLHSLDLKFRYIREWPFIQPYPVKLLWLYIFGGTAIHSKITDNNENSNNGNNEILALPTQNH